MRCAFPLLLLAVTLALPMSAHGAVDTALVVWAPPAAALSQAVTYDVYGAEDGLLVLLGSTQQTAFAAPAAYSGYTVKFRDAAGVHDIGTPCVYYYPDGPGVGMTMNC